MAQSVAAGTHRRRGGRRGGNLSGGRVRRVENYSVLHCERGQRKGDVILHRVGHPILVENRRDKIAMQSSRGDIDKIMITDISVLRMATAFSQLLSVLVCLASTIS